MKAKFSEYGWEKQKEWIHFALTSQDINNTAIPLSIKEALHQVYLPTLRCARVCLHARILGFLL